MISFPHGLDSTHASETPPRLPAATLLPLQLVYWFACHFPAPLLNLSCAIINRLYCFSVLGHVQQRRFAFSSVTLLRVTGGIVLVCVLRLAQTPRLCPLPPPLTGSDDIFILSRQLHTTVGHHISLVLISTRPVFPSLPLLALGDSSQGPLFLPRSQVPALGPLLPPSLYLNCGYTRPP